jgi:hypothetical protein
MAELVERVRGAAVAHAAALRRAEPGAAVDYLVVDLPCTFFMLRASRCAAGPRSVRRVTRSAPASLTPGDMLSVGAPVAAGWPALCSPQATHMHRCLPPPP